MPTMTIDQLDIAVYIQYAQRTEFIEQINKELRLTEAATIPPQTFVVQQQAVVTDLELLLGVIAVLTPWAHFLSPKKFRKQRRSSFSFSQITPTLGTVDKLLADSDKLEKIKCKNYTEEEEKKTLLSCLKNIDSINEMLAFVIGRMAQFLQG